MFTTAERTQKDHGPAVGARKARLSITEKIQKGQFSAEGSSMLMRAVRGEWLDWSKLTG